MITILISNNANNRFTKYENKDFIEQMQNI